jgi:tryptophan 7-halogenase
MTYKISIIGGGTAGWMAASYLKTIYDEQVDIEIIYDHSQPNIGVGESTTPTILMFLEQVGISYNELIQEIGATLKLGIKFQNWTDTESHYWHPFNLANFDANITDSNVLAAYETATDQNFNAECFTPDYMNSGIVPIDKELKPFGNFALHIDGDKFSKFLKHRFENKVTVIDDIVEEIDCDIKINAVKLKSGKIINADLFVDCTGLSRLLISKNNNTWEEPKDFSFMNRSIPIQIKETPDLSQTYTLAEAHRFGWLWKIPLQERYGIGYNFNSKYLNDDQAIDEFKRILKSKEINYEGNFRIIKYNPGYYKESWKSNVLSIGLSTGFIEPLEATAIHMICNQLMHFVRHNTFLETAYSKDVYNKKMSKMYEQTFEFIELHYYGGRQDSEFWKDIDLKKSKKMSKFVEKVNLSFLNASDILVDFDRIQGALIFSLTGYTRIMSGLNLINKTGAEHFLTISNLKELGKNVFDKTQEFRKQVDEVSIQATDLYLRIKNG